MSSRGGAPGRGRAGGRGRASAAPAPGAGPAPRRPGETVAAGPQGAWAARPQAAPAAAPRPQGAWGQQQQPQQRAQQPGGAGRAPSQLTRGQSGDAAQVVQQMGQMSLGGGSSGDASRSVGRGSMRGNRHIGEVVVRTRPDNIATKIGTAGRQVLFTSNYFRFVTKPDWCLYQYRVDFTPEEDRTHVRRALVRVHRERLGAYIFDGTVMFISHRLSNTDEAVTFTSQRQGDDQIINISCRLVGDVMYGNPQYLQFFNLVFRNFMGSLELQMVKRDYFDAKNKIEIREHNMELWPGYQTSIRQHEQEILLCAEVTHKVMRMESCLDILAQCTRNSRGDYQTLFSKAVVGTVVLTDYNNRTYRIDDVDWSINPSSTFRRGNQDVTYMAYMYEKYQIKIRDARQPMLVSKSKPREVRAGQSDVVYLIPEVCRCTGLTEDIRSNFRVMQDLARHTRLTPANRSQALLRFIRRLIDAPRVREGMNLWQMRIADTMTQIPGRVLPDETINFGGGKKSPPSADWMKDMRSSPYVHTVPLKDWAVVFPGRLGRETENFVSELRLCGRGMGFQVPDPMVVEMRDDSASSYVNNLGSLLDRARYQIVLCVMQGQRADRYQAIKKVCYIDRGVPSQVVTAKVMGRGKSVATKVILQMACKIGCIPWSVPNPAKGTMVVGFDVCHDSARKELSFGAMVASTNDTFGSYFSCVAEHKQGNELSNNFAANVLKAVKEWERQNGAKPTRIVVYRDGVGDGDIAYVHEHEVTLVKQKLAEVYGSPDGVKFTFIIVNKRIKTRYFLNNDNPPPGSVVDDVITQPERYDFYLVSQYVGQGSVSPTSYNVISDTSGWKAEIIQRMTYKLTHMYYNWPGPVRVPAPCQYAHKLAFLVGQALHRSTSSELETTLYYL